MVAKRASRVLVAFEESLGYYNDPGKVEVVGMPLQQGFIYADKKSARQQLGLGQEDFVVLSAFGSLGAKHMNEMVAELMCMEKEAGYPFHHIHATGQYGVELLPRLLREKDKGIICMDDFIARYTELALLDECGYFMLMLKVTGVDDACIFLKENRCMVHAAKPRTCRI